MKNLESVMEFWQRFEASMQKEDLFFLERKN